MVKKLICMVLAVLILASAAVPVFAAEGSDQLEAAETLNALGLFGGIGKNEDGSINYDLTSRPTREQAVVMLVRLLGKEAEAKAGSWPMPFADVAVWAQPYVGYAYAMGLTTGLTATSFGGSDYVTATQYLTFVLRALGYTSGQDFTWSSAWEKTDVLGITHGEYSAANNSGFTRGGIALVSVSALMTAMKGSDTLLLDRLLEDGVVAERTIAASGLRPDDYTLFVREIIAAGQETYTIPLEDKYLSIFEGDLVTEILGENDSYYSYAVDVTSEHGREQALVAALKEYVTQCYDGNYDNHSPSGTGHRGFLSSAVLLFTDSLGTVVGYGFYDINGPESVELHTCSVDSRAFVDNAIAELRESVDNLPQLECRGRIENGNYVFTVEGLPETAVKYTFSLSRNYFDPVTEDEAREKIMDLVNTWLGNVAVATDIQRPFAFTWPVDSSDTKVLYVCSILLFMDAYGYPVAYAFGVLPL